MHEWIIRKRAEIQDALGRHSDTWSAYDYVMTGLAAGSLGLSLGADWAGATLAAIILLSIAWLTLLGAVAAGVVRVFGYGLDATADAVAASNLADDDDDSAPTVEYRRRYLILVREGLLLVGFLFLAIAKVVTLAATLSGSGCP